jgi:Holliday junction resolvase RusA-like endonuclease
VALAVVVVGNRPKTRPDWADLEKWKDGIRLWRPVRPDDDNYGKAVRDAMNSRIFVDDSQIVASLAYKVVAANGEATKVLVWCGPIEEETVIFAHCKGGLGRIL